MPLRRGFSLVELLVVIAIIGVLASLGVYAWASAGAKSRDNTRKSDLGRLKNALEQYYLDNKEYPNFATNPDSVIYSATWQLSSGTTCAKQGTLVARLTPTYIEKIPEDPKQEDNLKTKICADLIKNQQDRFYYLSAPSDAGDGPEKPATSFGLMAHLERPATDEPVADASNPLKTLDTFFGGYYAGFGNYSGPSEINSDVNYLQTGRFGR